MSVSIHGSKRGSRTRHRRRWWEKEAGKCWMRRTSSWFAFLKNVSYGGAKLVFRRKHYKRLLTWTHTFVQQVTRRGVYQGKQNRKDHVVFYFHLGRKISFWQPCKYFIWTKNVQKINGQIDYHRYPGGLFKLGPEYKGEQKMISRWRRNKKEEEKEAEAKHCVSESVKQQTASEG